MGHPIDSYCVATVSDWCVAFGGGYEGSSAKDTITEIGILYQSSVTRVQTVRSWFRFRIGNFYLEDEKYNSRPIYYAYGINQDHAQKFWKDGIMRLPERWRKIVEQNG
ncbi:Histone-lysine N-methyltransferase SETMAR [Vespula squamosa]|uniref:Histone-lysine N-methyltransferase SETMAR n=1 Tax=Vespula squamosa TaxID=30214 RepID=A0ABD2BTG1_VESSQ